MTNRVLWSLCRKLISIGRRGATAPPDIMEIIHYAVCRRCSDDIKAQGWRVECKREKKRIWEVTFKSMEIEEYARFLRDYMEGEEEEEEDEEEGLEVKRPTRLVVEEKRPKAEFYV